MSLFGCSAALDPLTRRSRAPGQNLGPPPSPARGEGCNLEPTLPSPARGDNLGPTLPSPLAGEGQGVRGPSRAPPSPARGEGCNLGPDTRSLGRVDLTRGHTRFGPRSSPATRGRAT